MQCSIPAKPSAMKAGIILHTLHTGRPLTSAVWRIQARTHNDGEPKVQRRL